MNKLYRGIRQNHEAKVFVDNIELSLAASKILHPSEATAEWGYFGEGPSQLSLAILFDAIQDYPNADKLALQYYHDFKFEFIACAHYDLGFTILESQVKEWIDNRLDMEKGNQGGWLI